jgi:hypothetical protein
MPEKSNDIPAPATSAEFHLTSVQRWTLIKYAKTMPTDDRAAAEARGDLIEELRAGDSAWDWDVMKKRPLDPVRFEELHKLSLTRGALRHAKTLIDFACRMQAPGEEAVILARCWRIFDKAS